MKTTITKISPHLIKLDLEEAGAIKVADITTILEYFDTLPDQPHQFQPYFIPPRFQNILQSVYNITTEHQTLQSVNASLYLKEENEQCELVFEKSINDKKSQKEIITVHLPLREWANVEEFLLTCGLRMTKRLETKKIIYSLPAYQATFTLMSAEDPSSLELVVEAPDEPLFIEALTKVGFSLDETTGLVEDAIRRKKMKRRRFMFLRDE